MAWKEADRMLRFLVKFLLLTIILVAATILLAQWKLEKDIQSFARAISPVAEFDYEAAKISLTGEVRINAVRIYVDALKSTIEIGELRFFVGGLYELAFLESNLKQYQLPDNAYLQLKDVLLPFSSAMLKAVKEDSPPDSLDLINAAYCGNNDRIRLSQWDAMGYNYLSFSSKSFYLLDKYSGSVVLNGDASFEDMADVEYQINIGGVLAWAESMEDSGVGQYQPPIEKPELALLEVRVKDHGFNRKKAEYCAIQQGVSTEEYYVGHVQAVSDLLESVDIKMTEVARQAYSKMIQPESLFVGFIQPKPAFEFDGINYYNQQEMLDMTGLRISVNGENVAQYFDNWSMKSFKQIALNDLQKHLQETPQQNQRQIVKERDFQEINLATAENFLSKNVRVTRDDGHEFEGILLRTSEKSLWISQRSAMGGNVTLPIDRNRIAKVEVYQ